VPVIDDSRRYIGSISKSALLMSLDRSATEPKHHHAGFQSRYRKGADACRQLRARPFFMPLLDAIAAAIGFVTAASRMRF
jgi:predicted transcriptional regulator